MLSARFNDGRSARTHPVTAEIVGQALRFEHEGREHVWSLKRLNVDLHAGEARLSHPDDRDARLVVEAAAWRQAARPHAAVLSRRGRELRLLGGLVVLGAAVAGLVFFGVPAMSGPLARMTPVAFEEGMGDNFDAQVSLMFKACEQAQGQAVLYSLGQRLAEESGTPFDIRVRAVHAPMVNALALPGGVILVTDDLIREAESPDELAAVVAHEVAHIELRHVMQAVWRSLGVGLLLDAVVGGGTGAGQQAVIMAGQATDLRYGRKAEEEADERGQALLHGLGLSSMGMAPFFDRMARHDGSERSGRRTRSATEFLSTHPDTVKRAERAREHQRPGRPALEDAEWAAVQAVCTTPQTSR